MHFANVGDYRTVEIHPEITMHSQFLEKEEINAGVKSDLIRLSVDIEDIDDII